MLSIISCIIRRIVVSAIIRWRITGSSIIRMCISIIRAMCAWSCIAAAPGAAAA